MGHALARPNRNMKRDRNTVRLYDFGLFHSRISNEDAEAGEARGDYHRKYEDRNGQPHLIGYELNPAGVSTGSQPTPASLTKGDVETVLGITRHPDQMVKPGRRIAIANKIREFGAHPSWLYRGKQDGDYPGLTRAQKAAVDQQIAKGATSGQAAKRLGLTKEYVDAYVKV